MTTLAAVLRMVALGRLPPGLYHDEAYNGLDALQVLAGHRSIYFAANYGREPLYIYLTALPIYLLGRTPAAVRLAAAITGTLTIPAATLWARSWFGRRVGLLTGAVLSVTLWHVHLSRVAFRAVTLPLVTALALWAGASAWRSRSWSGWLVAGLAYGACFYTYLPARFTLLVLAAWLGVLLWSGRARRLWPGALWFALGTGLALLPLGVYAIGHWQVVMGRPGAVSVFSPLINQGDLGGTLLRHLGRTLGMFFVAGDTIPRHNLPGRPVFDLALALAMVVGVVWAATQARRRVAAAFLLIWVAVMLVPTWLAEDAPHFLRAVGVLPLLAALPALGMDELWRRLEGWGRPWWGAASAVVILVCGLGSTAWDYFVRYPSREDVGYLFEEAATRLAADVNRYLGTGWPGDGWTAAEGEPPADRQVFIEERLWEEWAAIPFLVSAPEAVVTRPEQMGDSPYRLLVLWPHQDYRARLDLLPHPARIRAWEGPLARGDLDPLPFTAYVAVAAEPVSPAAEPLARFEDGINLVEAAVTPQPGNWRVALIWEAGATPQADYTVFLHLWDGAAIVSQADGEPAAGYYPTSVWRVGDQVVDVHLLALPDDWETEPRVTAGLYLRPTLERLAVLDAEGQPTGDEVPLPVP